MADETVREVCAEMRGITISSGDGLCPIDRVKQMLTEAADRILAAHQREVAAHERCYQSLQAHCAKLEAEYLRATNALKPVLECISDWGDVEGECSCRERIGAVNHACHNAVREAQRVMKEGGAK